MKLALLLTLISTIQTFAIGYTQTITLRIREQPLPQVMEHIQEQSGYLFFLQGAEIASKKVTLDIQGIPLHAAMDVLTEKLHVEWVLKDNTIVIRPMPRDRSSEPIGYAQSTITGKVTDAEGTPLEGVTIRIKETSVTTKTDDNGNYRVDVSGSGKTLAISMLGYETKETPIAGKNRIDIILTPSLSDLDEVVVVGYGTQRKRDLTGAISSVSSREISAYPAAGATQALQGRSAGVEVTSVNGEPGATPRIRVRGGTSINASSQPLYVVDGFAGGSPPPPEDIASMEILKDASATAIYGSRGANGVVLITTKSGKTGKTLVELNTTLSSQQVGKRLQLLNATEFAEYINDVYTNAGNNNIPYPDPQGFGVGTDWQDLIFRTGLLQNHQLSANGGGESVRFYTSLSHYGQQGTVINSDFKRLSGTLNLDINASQRLKIGMRMHYRRSDLNGVRTQETSSGASGAGVISAALRFEPLQGVYDENGKYTLKQVGDPHDNPVAVALERENETQTDIFQGNAFAELEIIKGLKMRSTLGIQTNNRRTGEYVPTTLVQGRNTGGTGSISAQRATNVLSENYLTYNKEVVNGHILDLMGGYSYQESRTENWMGANRDFISDGFSFWNLGGGSNYQSATSSLGDWTLSSFYGRANYSINDRYLFTVTGRYDGSSRFGTNNKWAFFPSGAVAWNVTEEQFLRDVPWLSNLKIRASYGETGNTEIGSYQSLARFSPTLNIVNGEPVNAVRPTAVANHNLTWEATRQTNAGLDFGVLDNRIGLTVDYYYKKTVDMLYAVPLPGYSGYTSSLQNVGSLENKGWEFTLSAAPVRGEFAWNSQFNITFNRNKILALPGGEILYNSIPGHMLSTESQILREGEVVGAFFGWVADGVYQMGDDFSAQPNKQPGDIKYRDIFGRGDDNQLIEGPNGTVNADDRTIIGNPHPDFTFGFNNDFSYRNFDLNVFLQGSYGNDMLNITRMELDWMAGKGNATKDALNRWTPTHTNTDVPRASASNNPEVSSRWVEDGSYLRVKNVTLGYTFPQPLLERWRITKLRLFASAQNILTFTKYTGFDPEISFNDSNRNIGLDYMGYPNVKSVTFGLNIGL